MSFKTELWLTFSCTIPYVLLPHLHAYFWVNCEWPLVNSRSLWLMWCYIFHTVHRKHHATRKWLRVLSLTGSQTVNYVTITVSENIIIHIKLYVVTYGSVFSADENERQNGVISIWTNNRSCNCILLTFIYTGFLIFLFWFGPAYGCKFTSAYHSCNFGLIQLTPLSAGSQSCYSSPLCETWRRSPGTPSHHSTLSCCCHIMQWPYPSLQANIFTDRYLTVHRR